MIEAALRVGEQPVQRRRPIPPVGRTLRLEVVDADLGRRVHVPAWLRQQRSRVAADALGLALEQLRAAGGGHLVEAVRRRGRRGQRQLIGVQPRQLRGHPVLLGRHHDVPESVLGGDRESNRVVEPRIVEVTDAVHLQHRDERIPVRDRSPSGPGVQVDARQSEGGRDQGRRRLAVGPEPLAVHQQLGVELARTPRSDDGAHGRLVDAKQLGDGREIWRRSDDGTHVQIAIRPPVQALSNPRREGIVDGGMTDRALNPHRLDLPGIVEEAGDADDGIELHQRQGRRGIVQVDRALFESVHDLGRQCRDVDLEAQLQRGRRADACADAAIGGACDGLMKLQGVAPEDLVTEGIEPEGLFPFLHRA